MLIDTKPLGGNTTIIYNATNGTEMARFRTGQDANRVMARAIASRNMPNGHVSARDFIVATADEMGVKLVQRRK